MPIRLFTKGSENAQKLIKEGKVDVVGAYYDFGTGEVRILTPEK